MGLAGCVSNNLKCTEFYANKANASNDLWKFGELTDSTSAEKHVCTNKISCDGKMYCNGWTRIPECDEFLSAYKKLSIKLGIEDDGALKILRDAIAEDSSNVMVTCDGINYWVGPLF